MAKKTRTPEEIDEMEIEVREARQAQTQEAARENRKAAKPLIDFVGTPEFHFVNAQIAMLEELAIQMPAIKVHVDALQHGLFGLNQQVELLAPSVEEGSADEAAAIEPAA